MKLIKFTSSHELGNEKSTFINPLYVESVSPSPQNNWTDIGMTSKQCITVKNSINDVIKMLDTAKE